MKEVKSLLKLVSDGLKTLAQGVEAVAEKVDDASKAKSPPKAADKKPAAPAKKAPTAAKPTAPAKKKKTAPAAKPAAQAAPKKAAKPDSATVTVLNIISSTKKGADTAQIKSKTGYDQKKVANIVYKLKKQNKIKSIDKGVYVKM